MGAPLTITITAHELRPGDWLEGRGIVQRVFARGTTLVRFASGVALFKPDEPVLVRLEDYGEEEQ